MTDHDEGQDADQDADQGADNDAELGGDLGGDQNSEQDAIHAEWVAVGTFTTGLEADMARNSLENAGIPVFTKGEQPGIFGGGYGGNISGGIVLHVPSPEVDRAQQILEPSA